MKKILILGSGAAGTMVAAKLRKELSDSEWKITMIDNDEVHLDDGAVREGRFARLLTHYVGICNDITVFAHQKSGPTRGSIGGDGNNGGLYNLYDP